MAHIEKIRLAYEAKMYKLGCYNIINKIYLQHMGHIEKIRVA